MKKTILPKPTNYEKFIAKVFSEECYSSVSDNYSSRSQENQEKVKLDMEHGKLAEILIRRYFTKNKINSSAPDFLIYPPVEKTFDADLFTFKNDNFNKLHIKSCMIDSNFPISWIFQPDDKVTIVPEKNDYFVLVVLDFRNWMSESYFYTINANNAIKLYRNPKKTELNKKVIYEEDLMVV